MKGPIRITLLLLLVASLVPVACNRKQADIPDVNDIISNIHYLDSLSQSDVIDSIDRINDGVAADLLRYANRAQTPDDKSILDSLGIISENVNQFLRFCTETPDNLEIMEQEVRETRSQYLGGKMDIATYISNLLQYEQLLVDINNRLSDQIESMRIYLSKQAQLIPQLNPLPINE